jgi:hypothetical protein
MDLLGSVIFPLRASSSFPAAFSFGWGKPVMINMSNFQNRKRDEILTTLAGPFSNLMLALVAAVVGGLLFRFREPRTARAFRPADHASTSCWPSST